MIWVRAKHPPLLIAEQYLYQEQQNKAAQLPDSRRGRKPVVWFEHWIHHPTVVVLYMELAAGRGRVLAAGVIFKK